MSFEEYTYAFWKTSTIITGDASRVQKFCDWSPRPTAYFP